LIHFYKRTSPRRCSRGSLGGTVGAGFLSNKSYASSLNPALVFSYASSLNPALG